MAYDKVSIPIILNKLIIRNAPLCLSSILHHLFTPQYSRVTINGLISDPFQRECGLFQGSILAPLLFNIFIDDLAKQTIPKQIYENDPQTSPPIQLFADDIKCSGNSVEEVQAMSNIVEMVS